MCRFSISHNHLAENDGAPRGSLSFPPRPSFPLSLLSAERNVTGFESLTFERSHSSLRRLNTGWGIN